MHVAWPKMNKRIAMVAYTHYSTDARPRRAAEALAARGDIVDFFALNESNPICEEQLRGVQWFGIRCKRYRGNQIWNYMASYMEFFVRTMAVLTSRHLKTKYDVVYVHTMPDFLVFASAPLKALGTKIILDIHDTMPELYQSKFGMKQTHPWFQGLALQEQWACSFAHRVICVNELHKELLLKRGTRPDKLVVILNLPDPSIFGVPKAIEPETTTQDLRIVYHGTVSRRLGLDLALRAFGKALQQFPQARFDIYGSGDAADEVVRLVQDLHLESNVYFANEHFRVDAIPELLNNATIGIVPNRNDPATRIMLPVKLLEYVHLGIPVVCAKLETIEHYFKDNAVAFFEPGNSDAMANTLCKVLESKTQRTSLAKKAREFCDNYSWEKAKQVLFSVVDA